MENKFDFEEYKVIEEINKRNCKKVLIQLPEGIKQEASRLSSILESKTNAEIIISGEPCWGGCDIALDEARNLKVDLLVHFGHAQFIKSDFPILYIELKDNTDLTYLLEKVKIYIENFKKLGLVSSIQHIHKLNNIKEFFNNKEIIIPNKKGFSHYDGHVVGCEYNSLKSIEEEVDAFLVIGNRFHSLGASLSVNKPVFLIDVYNQEILNMEEFKDKVIRQRFAAIEKVKNSKSIGIIIGTKPGQVFGSYKVIKDKFKSLNKEVAIITMNEITQDKLTNLRNIDAFVELACPRIAVEDYGKYNKPIITFRESLVVLNELKWEDLLENGFL